MVLVGIVGVAGANSNYYASIKRIGMARSANLVLLQPFDTAIGSFYIFEEKTAALQWAFGSLMLVECELIFSVGEKKELESAKPPQNSPNPSH